MNVASPKLIFALLISLAYTLATSAHLRAISRPDAAPSDGAFKKLLGDGRRLFAGQFVEMADVYLHSGFYPSIFDRRDAKAPKVVTGKTAATDEPGHETDEHQGHKHDAEGKCVDQDDHEKAMGFMGQPRDWLEGFIRRFRITKHSHLEDGQEREILPWLKLAIELDPQAIETYTATAYWLRRNLDRPKDAEEVLREGIRNNPNSYEILFELGVIYKDAQNIERARNIWVLALRRWYEQTDEAKSTSPKALGQITANLARLERDAGNSARAIHYFELTKLTSPNPAAVQKQIDELKLSQGNSTNSVPIRPIP